MIAYDMLQHNWQLLLDLSTREGVGAVTQDYSKAHHLLTFHGPPTWRQLPNDLNYLSYNPATPDWLDCPGAGTADLNFVAHAFTLATWVNYGGVGSRYLMCRGLINTDGWEWYVNAASGHSLITSQAAASQITSSVAAVVPIGAWTLLAVTRAGAVVTPYVNGVPSRGLAEVHVNPLTSARELHIGINDAEAAGFYSGSMWRPRVWGSRALLPAEMKLLYEHERGLLGV